MASTAVISTYALSEHHRGIQYRIGNVSSVKAASIALFALLEFPLAITYNVPFSVTAELTADAGGGQDICLLKMFSNGAQLSSYPIFWRN